MKTTCPWALRLSAPLFVAGSALMLSSAASAETLKLASPQGLSEIVLETSDKALPSLGVSYQGDVLISGSKLGLVAPEYFGRAGFKLTGTDRRSVNAVYRPVVGKASEVPDRYNELELRYEAIDKPGATLTLIFRAYDEGVAFRYVLPTTPSEVKIRNEVTALGFTRDFTCWGLNQGRFINSHEGEFDITPASKIRNQALYDAPLVCKTGKGQAVFAVAESDAFDYPVGYLTGRGDGELGVEVVLPPRFDTDPGKRFDVVAAKVAAGATDYKTSWRVVMLGQAPGALTTSHLIDLLATPTALKDTGWIKPGKSAWDWWNGYQAPVANPGINTETYKAYIDFAAKMKLEYILIDEGWYQGSSVEPNPADVTKPIAAVDIPALVAEGKSKGVGIWVWVQWQQLEGQMDAALAAYEAWGLKGIKIDFMNRNDQEMVAYYHRLLPLAAKHHLMVDLHGAYPPNGLARTYPNFMTQEGVMGAEYNKWSARVTATHNVTLPFTRMILGPIDYTPGGFSHVKPEDMPKSHRFIAPVTQTTRGQALAMYVVYDSPVVMVSDAPQAYVSKNGVWASGAEFIKDVPASWDETRVLAGDIGVNILTARRKGKAWYLGGMTNEAATAFAAKLDFLGAGAYEATIFEDGAAIDSVAKRSQRVKAGDTLTLRLAPSGGAVAVLRPVKK